MSRPCPPSRLHVVELSTRVTGEYCGKLFADFGAEVIKVEPPGGSPTRGGGLLDHAVRARRAARACACRGSHRRPCLGRGLPHAERGRRRDAAARCAGRETRTILGPFWTMSNGAAIDTGAPRLGEHNAYVFGEVLGLSAEEQARLEKAGAIR